MELYQLKYFLYAAKYENISKAAQALRVSQPSISRAVASLEKELQVELFGEGLRAAVGDATGSAAEGVALAVGVLLLFAAAVFVTALVVGRMRATSDDAGGNAAAAVPR